MQLFQSEQFINFLYIHYKKFMQLLQSKQFINFCAKNLCNFAETKFINFITKVYAIVPKRTIYKLLFYKSLCLLN